MPIQQYTAQLSPKPVQPVYANPSAYQYSNAKAQAISQIGQSMDVVSGLMQKYQSHLDDLKTAEVNTVLETTELEIQAMQESEPAENWEQRTQEILLKTRDKTSYSMEKMSGDRRRLAEEYIQRFEQSTDLKMKIQATKAISKDNLDMNSAAYQMALENGNTDKANVIYENMLEKHRDWFGSKDEFDAYMNEIKMSGESKFAAKQKKAQDEFVYSNVYNILLSNPTDEGKKEAYKFIDSTDLTTQEKGSFMNRADDLLSGMKIEKENQQADMAAQLQLLVWSGDMYLPSDVDSFLKDGKISLEQARALRSQLEKPDKTTKTQSLQAIVDITESIDKYHSGKLYKKNALDTLFKNAELITPEKGEQFYNEIINPPKQDTQTSKQISDATEHYKDWLFAQIPSGEKAGQSDYEKIDQFNVRMKSWVKDNPEKAKDPAEFYAFRKSLEVDVTTMNIPEDIYDEKSYKKLKVGAKYRDMRDGKVYIKNEQDKAGNGFSVNNVPLYMGTP
jgi:hypothetical protein